MQDLTIQDLYDQAKASTLYVDPNSIATSNIIIRKHTHVIYTNDDICNAKEKVIVHGCNAQGVMGSGVAKALKDKWKEVFTDYYFAYQNAKKHKKDHLPLGTCITSFVKSDNKIVVNAITQENFGRDGKKYVSYDAIDKAFKTIFKFCTQNDITEIAIPKIGAGLGGGDWNIIYSIILNNAPNNMKINVYLGPPKAQGELDYGDVGNR